MSISVFLLYIIYSCIFVASILTLVMTAINLKRIKRKIKQIDSNNEYLIKIGKIVESYGINILKQKDINWLFLGDKYDIKV